MGDPNGSEVKLDNKSTRDCAIECLKLGANYITILNNGVEPFTYVDSCWCESGVTSIDNSDTAYRAAPIVCKLEDL